MSDQPFIYESGTASFRPKARLLHLLGMELITDEIIAVVELVKNCYDADATKVVVELTDVTKNKNGKVEIRDNGHGMTIDQVKHAWMEPARDNKSDDEGGQKKRTAFGRLPLGEKGVGRFSADKLGLRIELVTRSCIFEEKTKKVSSISDKEVALIMDSTKFTPEAYLDEVKCDWTIREPIEFIGDNHGTLIRISNLRAPWPERLVRKVHLGLSRLSSPVYESKEFQIIFRSNEFPALSESITNPLLKIAPWYLDASIDADGTMNYTYRGPKEESKGRLDLTEGTKHFNRPENTKERRKPMCGPFSIRLYGFEKDRKQWKRYSMDKERIEMLAALCGVSIYRDGFRVWPYGEHGNDWLELDRARVQDPGRILGNDRIIGYVEISQEKNYYLRDKTNREGLIEEGNAYGDLKELTFAAVDFLSLKRWISTPHKKRSKAKREEAKEEISTASSEVNETSSTNIGHIIAAKKALDENRYDDARQELEKAGMSPEKIVEALRLIGKGLGKLMEELAISDDQIENLISLSGIGLTAERMTHEVVKSAVNAKKLLMKSKELLDMGNADVVVLKKNLELVRGQLDIVIDVMRQMEPLYYSRRKGTERLDVKQIAEDMKRFYSNTLRDMGIDLEILEDSKLTIDMSKGHLMQIFNNLFDNSFFWLQQKPPAGGCRILISITGKEERSIVFADNGPGVREDIQDHIFDAFVTTKTDGRGLGLYIVDDILQNYKAEIELVSENKLLPGANFRITFPLE